MFPKGIFLELQELHHQPGQRFVGRSICLDVLQDKTHTVTWDGGEFNMKTGSLIPQTTFPAVERSLKV